MKHQRLAFVPLVFATLALAACASGSSIVTGTTRTPIPSQQVKIYLEPPADFDVIGIVSATSATGWTEQGSVDYAIAELKNQAAKLGANGVVLTSTGDTTTGVVSGSTYAIPVIGKTVQGRAIFQKGQ